MSAYDPDEWDEINADSPWNNTRVVDRDVVQSG